MDLEKRKKVEGVNIDCWTDPIRIDPISFERRNLNTEVQSVSLYTLYLTYLTLLDIVIHMRVTPIESPRPPVTFRFDPSTARALTVPPLLSDPRSFVAGTSGSALNAAHRTDAQTHK